MTVRARLRRRRRASRCTARYREVIDGLEPRLLADAPLAERVGMPPAALERPPVPVAVVDPGDDAHHAVQAAAGDWVAIVPSGATLAEPAIERLGRAAALDGVDLVTCDDDTRNRRGRRSDPRLHPGPSPERALATAPGGALAVVRREAALAAGAPPGPAWAFETALRLARADGSAHAHVPEVLVHRTGPVADAPVGRRQRDEAVRRTLAAWGRPDATVEPGPSGTRTVRAPLAGEPSVEVIVCLRDRADLLRRCARSLLDRTAYERFTLHLVDNGSTDADTLSLLGALAEDPRVRVTRHPGAFNFAAINNAAAVGSGADVLVFLNNDTEVLEEAWLEDLAREALRPEIGAVGALLLHEDGRVQHAGAAIGIHGTAGHPFAGLRPDEETPFGSAAGGARNWLAVTAACLAVERATFAQVGGFDESFTVAGNDVDLGLRLWESGRRCVCLPHVRLLHDESATRDPRAVPRDDVERSLERYAPFLAGGDPFYHPLLTRRGTDCTLLGRDEE